MRQLLIFLALTCAPAFCQDDNSNIQFHYNPQWFPLLNAKQAGTPVHMPQLRTPQGAQGATNHMAVKPPAPICPAR